jgi:hypothetical protein
MSPPRWLTANRILRLHEIQIRIFGGRLSVRDHGLLESAVSLPKNTALLPGMPRHS